LARRKGRPFITGNTFPEALVERCLKAGCPEWVCSVCGKPRERIVERERPNMEVPMTPRERAQREEARRLYERQGLIGPSNNQKSRGLSEIWQNAKATRVVAESWSDCGHNNYRPGRVMDPFMGSGTTALVARRLGRHAIGIELKQEYAALSAQRTAQLSLLG
jgi:hypothetical protein